MLSRRWSFCEPLNIAMFVATNLSSGVKMSKDFNWLSVSLDFVMHFLLTEVVDVFNNEPDPCDTCASRFLYLQVLMDI